MATAEPLKLSPALQRFLEEGSDEEAETEQNIPASLALGDLDITTTDNSLRGKSFKLEPSSPRFAFLSKAPE